MAGKYIDEFPMACPDNVRHHAPAMMTPIRSRRLHELSDRQHLMLCSSTSLQLEDPIPLAHCQSLNVQVKASMRTLMGGAHASVTAACAEYHKRFRRNVYVTPKSYLSFLDGYRKLYSEKLAETRELASSINVGLQKMNDAKVDVACMKVGDQHRLWHGDWYVSMRCVRFQKHNRLFLAGLHKLDQGAHQCLWPPKTLS